MLPRPTGGALIKKKKITIYGQSAVLSSFKISIVTLAFFCDLKCKYVRP